MPTKESPSKRKAEESQGSDAGAGNKRRSLRDRGSIVTPTADSAKLAPMELLGSLTFDIAKSEEGWTVKEDRNGVTKTYSSKDGDEKFDSFEAIGEFAIALKDRMEALADDEGAVDALQQLAREGDKRAIAALENLEIELEELDEEEEEDAPSPAAKRNSKGGAGSKKRVVIGLTKNDYAVDGGEIAKFHDKLGEFLTASVEMFFSNFAAVVAKAESKLGEKNAPALEEIKALESELEAVKGDKKQLAKVEAELEEKREEVEKREKYHARQVKSLVKELGEQFLATGFHVPHHLAEEHKDLLEKYPVLKKTAFPDLKASTK